MNLSKWRSPIFFPTSLPEIGDIDAPSMDHTDYIIGMIGKCDPVVHWTFLCEVVEYTHRNFLGRPEMLCRDSAGEVFRVAGYFEGPLHRNQQFDRDVAPGIVAGNVLVIRYAQKKIFLDGTRGIRLEDEHVRFVRTVATSLSSLLTAGDRLAQHCSNPTVACWHCHREKSEDVKLLKCGSCAKRIAGYRAHSELNERARNASQAWYCGVDCQRADWSVRHKRECKLMDDLLELTGNGNAPFDLAVFNEDAKRGGWIGFRN